MLPSLQDRRVWQIGAAVVALLLVSASWLLFIGPQLNDGDKSRADAAATRQSNDHLRAHLGQLKAQSADAPRYRQQLVEALAALPPGSGLPDFTRQITAQAAAIHVTIDGITVGGISPVTPTGSSNNAASTGGSASAPAPTQGAAGATGIYAVQVSLTTHGTLVQEIQFLQTVQYRGARRALITGSSFGPAAGSSGTSIDEATTVTTQLTLFSAPQTPAQIAALKKLLSAPTGG